MEQDNSTWKTWVSRLILVPPAFILTRISLRVIAHPQSAAGEGVALGSAQFLTHMRVMGVFALGYAIVLAFCVLSRARVRMGLGIVAFIMASAIVARALGVMIDGTALQQEMHFFIPETVFLALSLTGLALAEQRSN